MFTSKAHGVLTLKEIDVANSLMFTSEALMPLIDGGFLFRGVVKSPSEETPAIVSIGVSSGLLHSVHIEKTGNSTYSAFIIKDGVSKEYTISLNEHPDTDQQFFGIIKSHTCGRRVYFAYTDIREPITIGTITVILIGAASFLCTTAIIAGLIANWRCRKVEVNYGFRYNPETHRFELGCKVRCIDGDEALESFKLVGAPQTLQVDSTTLDVNTGEPEHQDRCMVAMELESIEAENLINTGKRWSFNVHAGGAPPVTVRVADFDTSTSPAKFPIHKDDRTYVFWEDHCGTINYNIEIDATQYVGLDDVANVVVPVTLICGSPKQRLRFSFPVHDNSNQSNPATTIIFQFEIKTICFD